MKRKKHNIQANLGLGGNSEMNVIMWIHRMSNIESLYTKHISLHRSHRRHSCNDWMNGETSRMVNIEKEKKLIFTIDIIDMDSWRIYLYTTDIWNLWKKLEWFEWFFFCRRPNGWFTAARWSLFHIKCVQSTIYPVLWLCSLEDDDTAASIQLTMMMPSERAATRHTDTHIMQMVGRNWK